MSIENVELVTAKYHRVTIDGKEYERYSADNWRWIIGESTETVSFPDKLEAAFHLYEAAKLTHQPDELPVFKGRNHALFLTEKAKEYLAANPPIDWLKKIRERIHYPDCWDTMAYPSVWEAIWEVVSCVRCSVCEPGGRIADTDQKPPKREPQPDECAAIIKSVREVIKRRAVEDNSDLYEVIKMLKGLNAPKRESQPDESCQEALKWLVALKVHKDEHGKTPHYEEMQPRAWAAAKAALAGAPICIDCRKTGVLHCGYFDECGGVSEAPKRESQPDEGTKTLIADEKSNVWKDDNGDIWEPIRAQKRIRDLILIARTTLERKLQASDYVRPDSDPALYAQAAYICEDINEFIHLAHGWCEKAENALQETSTERESGGKDA